MLRKLLWTAVYGVISAIAMLGAKQAASRVWRLLTGEEPPTKK